MTQPGFYRELKLLLKGSPGLMPVFCMVFYVAGLKQSVSGLHLASTVFCGCDALTGRTGFGRETVRRGGC